MKKKVKSKRKSNGFNAFSMTAGEAVKRSFILLAFEKTIKGKLGFDLRTSDTKFLARSEAIAEAFNLDTGGYFTPPFSMLAQLVTQNSDLDTAIGNVALGVMGAEAAKNAAKLLVKLTLDFALAYVNGLARSDQANANEIITTAKMLVIGSRSSNKQDFSVKQGNASGEAILRSLAAKFDSKPVKAIYEWQMTNTPDMASSWSSVGYTTVANFTVTGLELDKKVWFRKRTITTKDGTSVWSMLISIVPK